MATTDSSVVRVQRAGQLTVLEFNGEIGDFNAVRAEAEIREIVEKTRAREVAFDLTNVDYLTTNVVSFFVHSLKYVDKLRVFNPSDFNVDLIRATNLQNVIEVSHGWSPGLYATGAPGARPAHQESSSGEAGETETRQEGIITDNDARPEAGLLSMSSRSYGDLRDHVTNEIVAFETALGDEFDVAIDLGKGPSFTLEKVTFRGDQLLVLAGKSEDGTPVELAQHVGQASFALRGTKRTKGSGGRSRIAIHTKSFPAAHGTVRS